MKVFGRLVQADQKVSTNASAPLAEIVQSRTDPSQTFFMQLYVDRNRPKTEKLLGLINDLGMKAIFVTVDAAAPGKREADERSRAEIEVVRLNPSMLCPISCASGFRTRCFLRIVVRQVEVVSDTR